MSIIDTNDKIPIPEIPPGSAPEIARWALKIIGIVLFALMTYATYTTDALKAEVQSLKMSRAVDEERWRQVIGKLEKIENILERREK